MTLSALPDLAEKRGLDAASINGTSADRLTTAVDGRASITFVDENAGYLNTLVAYEIGQDGSFGPAQVVFARVDGPDRGGGPLTSGDTVELGDFGAGTRLGLALLQDADARGLDLEDGSLEFRARDGSPANVGDGSPPELFHIRADGTETKVDVRIFHSTDGSPGKELENALNADGAEHTVSGIDTDGSVLIAFEDKLSTAKSFDGDYNDAIFKVTFEGGAGPGNGDPTQSVSSTPLTLPDGQTVALGVRTEATTSDDVAELSGVISLTGFLASCFNIAFVNDASGSTAALARDGAGQTIDLDGDGRPDTVFQAQVAAFNELAGQIGAAGLGNADLGVISFGSGASLDLETRIGDAAGLDAALRTPGSGGSTNFTAALQTAIDFFESQPDVDTASNIVYFLSDGQPNAGLPFAPTFDALTDPAGIDGLVNAFGAGTGTTKATLDQVDNTGGAKVFTDLSQLAAGLSGSSLAIDDILSVEISVNGVVQQTLDNTAFSDTPTGLQFGPVQLTGLDPAAVNTVDITAVLETDDGSLFDLVVETEIVGAGAPAEAALASAPSGVDTLVAEPLDLVA